MKMCHYENSKTNFHINRIGWTMWFKSLLLQIALQLIVAHNAFFSSFPNKFENHISLQYFASLVKLFSCSSHISLLQILLFTNKLWKFHDQKLCIEKPFFFLKNLFLKYFRYSDISKSPDKTRKIILPYKVSFFFM